MIGVTKEIINKIPCLVITNMKEINNPLPILTYFHGFTSAKEQNLPLAYLLAERGYRVILPDSEYHGEREQNVSEMEMRLAFWDIVMQSVSELQDIKMHYQSKGLLLDDRFGVAGTSMGGITTSATLTQYSWIKSAAILMGSPKISLFAKSLIKNLSKLESIPMSDNEIDEKIKQLDDYDLSKQMTKLNNRPLLFWHGEDDTIVPIDHSYTFYNEVKKSYQPSENIQFIKEANRDHKVSRYAIINTVKWFEKHL